MGDVPLSIENIFIDQEFSNQKDFFDEISKHLVRNNYVKSGYFESLITRETNYPTGLATGEINVAIPHTDYQFSNTTQLVITTLKKPIIFNRMDDPDETVSVQLIILILFDKPEKQLELLGKIMAIVQNQALLLEMLKAKTPEEICQLVNK